ncbi:hypothetical protein FOZ63_004159 [Perkinsus olseni]|uniref:Uncharacterized protein n=1 Tax=Perkinsus olseni TaxID=32597 RepID=A0A7J6QJS7_PEROL|nr:hypothetical protein FOZ62_004037 [Perkinsus olseni]KAF4737630.1 hypothetical protein FOZ63_004159 [Perkinsus olseni]
MQYTILYYLSAACSTLALRRRGSEYQLADLVTATSKILNALEETEQTMDRSVMWPLIPGTVEAPPGSTGSLRGSLATVKAVNHGTPLPFAQALLNVIISLIMSAFILTAAVVVYRHAVAGWLKKLSARRFLSPVLRGVHKPTRASRSSGESTTQGREPAPTLIAAPSVSGALSNAILAKAPESDSDNASTTDEESSPESCH